MENVRKSGRGAGQDFPASHNSTGEKKQAAARTTKLAAPPIRLTGLLPKWSGPTEAVGIDERFYQSLRLACKSAGITPQFHHDQPFPRNISHAFDDLWKKTVPKDEWCDFNYTIIGEGKDIGLIRKFFFCHFNDPCLIPIEQVLAMKEAGQKPALINMLMSTFAYLIKVCKFDGLDKYNYYDPAYEAMIDCLGDEDDESFDDQVKDFCQRAEQATKKMGEYLSDPSWLLNWEAHLQAFVPQEAEKKYKLVCSKLYELYKQYPKYDIYTGWVAGEDDPCDEDWVVYPDTMYALLYMGNVYHEAVDSGYSEAVKGYITQHFDCQVNCVLNETMYGLIYDKSITYAPKRKCKEPDFTFQTTLHELVYDLSFDLRELL